MPRIRNIAGPYRFFFYSFDCDERMHVHARRENRTCKFWLEPLELAANHHFTARGLNEIRRLVAAHRGINVDAWHEHCD